MTAQVEPIAVASAPPRAATGWFVRVETRLEPVVERFNPILVKEARQALKSRQFAMTFALVLIAGWVWSIYGLGISGPEAAYGAGGPAMFMGYFVILAFPLLIVVPFGAFRSIASEQEDRTYELLSITDLNPRQIVRGKLACAVAQMLVYLSAIAPCLAFTYMLRGLAFPTILYVIFWTVLGSLALSMIGLLLGTVTREKHWQVVLSVVLTLGLLMAMWAGCGMASGAIFWADLPFETAELWQITAAALTAYLGYFALAFYAAAAMITFASDNRATRLRVIMLSMHVLFTGWMAWLFVGPAEGDGSILAAYLLLLTIHWYALGGLMTGESPELSMRVRRRLPQSFLGRVFLTWFNPGPGTGYLFAVCGMLAGLATAWLGLRLYETLGLAVGKNLKSSWVQCAFYLGTLGTSYVTIYLGLGLVLIRLLRRLGHRGMFVAGLIQVVLVCLGVIVPMLIATLSQPWAYGYSVLHMSNPFWTMFRGVDSNSLPIEAPVLTTALPFAAAVVFVLNLPAVAREVRHVRIAKPPRVVEEDAALAAEHAQPPEPPKLQSPWD